MSLVVDVASIGVRAPLGRARAARVVERVLRAERVRAARVSVTFVDAAEMARLNWRHLRHRGPTDVISFPLADADGAVVGDIYVAPDVARAAARDYRIGVREELTRLLVHGTLHVLGYEHPEGEARERSPMWRRQEELVKRLREAP